MGVRPDGRVDRRHVQAGTEKAVTAKVRRLEASRDGGVTVEQGRAPTVAAWLDHWLTTVAPTRCKPATLRGYESAIRVQIVPRLGAHRVDRLQPEHVEAAWRGMLDDGSAPAYTLLCHRTLSRALTVAVRRRKLAVNPCTMIDAPTVRRDEVRPLSRDEVRAVLAAAAGRRNAARWSVALALGLRQGEALGLCWDDVDLDGGTVAVRRTLSRETARHGCAGSCGRKRAADCPQRRGGGLVLGTPKSRAGRRTVALPPPLLAALRAHRRAQAAERLRAANLWEDHGFVFATELGRPVDPRADWAEWKRLLAAAGVRDARLHDARHTAATTLLEVGVPARVVMEILGHSQISLTLGTYAHVAPEVARDAVDRVAAPFWGETAGG